MKFLKPKFWNKKQISIYSIFLYPLALLVRLINILRNLLIRCNKFSIPIICIGNIYIGGTGKTPLSIKIFSIYKNLNTNPVFIRKKYSAFQDEVDLQRNIGRVYESKKRNTAIENAIKDKADIAILDDGFQDPSVEKNLSIICFNEKQWIGNGLTIPSGPLREPLSSLKRAEIVLINGNKNIEIEKKILNRNKKIKIFYFKYNLQNIEKFNNKNIVAFAGIGNPINFFNLLERKNLKIVDSIEFPDHYYYKNEDLENLINKARNNNAVLLTTEKDYFRINENYRKKIEFLEIKVEMQNRNQFIEEIKKII